MRSMNPNTYRTPDGFRGTLVAAVRHAEDLLDGDDSDVVVLTGPDGAQIEVYLLPQSDLVAWRPAR